jgi:DNA-binding transcriptional MerR regulator
MERRIDGAPALLDQADHEFSIGDIAREFGVSLRALRFYENRGLLHPRRKGTSRLYSERDRADLKMILKGKQLGFTLSEIGEMLSSRGGEVQSVDLELALQPEQILAQIRHLERQRAELDAALAELKRAHQRAKENEAQLSAA